MYRTFADTRPTAPVRTRADRVGIPGWALALILALILIFALSGCGLADTGAAAAAGGVSQAQAVRDAKQTEDRMRQQIDSAYRKAAEQRDTTEAQ